MLRYGIIGTGHRAQMYLDAIAQDFRDDARLVAMMDTNPGRIQWHKDHLESQGVDVADILTGGPDDLERIIAQREIDTVIVTVPDNQHAEMICRSLRSGADVVVEKPLTINAQMARQIRKTVEETGRHVVVTFNYRYSPRNSTLKQVIASGQIGQVTSVSFEWVLDTNHGADYFRRWHRDKKNSGGLLIHKASHHFDLVNWWIDDIPARVFASGGVLFYGNHNADARGLPPRPPRGTHDGEHGPFELDLRSDQRLKELYLDQEHYDGYLRDQDVFGPGVTTEDNLSLVVDYRKGPSMSYSLNAHSPWEGYRVAVNGTEGRAELEVVERAYVDLDSSVDPSALKDHDGIRGTGESCRVQRHWHKAELVEINNAGGAHGGGDVLMLSDVFRGPRTDPLGRPSDYIDGLRAIAVGICGNESLATGKPVTPDQLGINLDR